MSFSNSALRWGSAAAVLAALVAAPWSAAQESSAGGQVAEQALPAPETAAVERQAGYVPPPRALKHVADHWTPYDPPTPPADARVHVVAPGDCLWNLAQHYYENPYTWPVIWDANRYVTYAHWIYPGDPLVIPPSPTVVGEGGPAGAPVAVAAVETPEAAPVAAAAPPAAPPAPPAPRGPVLVPAAEQQELACAAQLPSVFDPAPLTISGAEEPEKSLQAQGDVVYLSAGTDMGIAAGTDWVVTRPGALIHQPGTRRVQAQYVSRLGRVRVIAVQEHTATAEVVLSCDAMRLGDFVVPYREVPVPMIERIPLERLAQKAPGRLDGLVVFASTDVGSMAGAGDLVGIDLGAGAGLTVGDRILFWRPNPGVPRRVLAQGVVLSTNGGGSVVKLLESRIEVKPGDHAELL
ncbi:MAG: LysM peptidoglycan-binding domain-containing protein [Acidobacteria bacterium]|nr:LysM peptidoglycan-binding domain-containing protein [Acidobacteriota bacterium]